VSHSSWLIFLTFRFIKIAANFEPMDEYNRGMDPEIKRYFKKIINSFSFGALWLLVIATAGLFFRLGIAPNGMKWYNIVFYMIAGVSFIGLMYYYYKLWSKRD
jgi:hypothetical protein